VSYYTNTVEGLDTGRENLSYVLREAKVMAEGDSQNGHFGDPNFDLINNLWVVKLCHFSHNVYI